MTGASSRQPSGSRCAISMPLPGAFRFHAPAYFALRLSRVRTAGASVILVCLMPPVEAWAQPPDLEFGQYLATECLTCHRNPTAGGAIPNIFGMEEPKFTALIEAFRDKKRPNPVMQSVAGRLKDDEIKALAHYFAVTKRP
jgi:cytochrome c553